jgi:hypothetical protein
VLQAARPFFVVPFLSRLGSIGAAGVQALLARLGALLAVVVLVLGAFVVALLANFDALAHDVRRMGRVTRNKSGRESTDIGAVAVEPDAGHLHGDIFFLEAGIGAILAGSYAAGEGREDILVFGRGVFHKIDRVRSNN